MVVLVEKDEWRKVILSIVHMEHDIGSNGSKAKCEDFILQAFSKRFGRLKCAVRFVVLDRVDAMATSCS